MPYLIPLVLAALFCVSATVAQENAADDLDLVFDFDSHDTNGDGYLTEAEWQDARSFDIDFAAADANRDGYIEEQEARAVLATPATPESSRETDAATPEENYLGTGYDPLSSDPADNEIVSSETEAAASGDVDREVPAEVSAAGREQPQAASENRLPARERGAQPSSLPELDSSQDGQVSREEAAQDPQVGSHFVVWDANQDGYLDQQEIDQGREQNANSDGRKDVNKESSEDGREQDISLAEEDIDGDGKIAPEEASTDVDFDTLDSNRDGYLDAAEVNYDPGERDLADAAEFDVHDADGDSRLNRTEAANDPYVNANFDAWDSDRDGYLEEEEVNAGWPEEGASLPEENPEENEENNEEN